MLSTRSGWESLFGGRGRSCCASLGEDGDSSRSGPCFQLQQSPGGLAALPACCSAARTRLGIKGAEPVLSTDPLCLEREERWRGSGVVGDAL